MTLLTEIQTKCSPELLATKNLAAIAVLVNAGRMRIEQPRMIGEGLISDVLGQPNGPIFIRALRLMAEAELPEGADLMQTAVKATVEQAWRLLSNANLDIGLPSVRSGLVGMVGPLPGLTMEGVDAILKLAEVDDPVSERDVLLAVYADNGDYLA